MSKIDCSIHFHFNVSFSSLFSVSVELIDQRHHVQCSMHKCCCCCNFKSKCQRTWWKFSILIWCWWAFFFYGFHTYTYIGVHNTQYKNMYISEMSHCNFWWRFYVFFTSIIHFEIALMLCFVFHTEIMSCCQFFEHSINKSELVFEIKPYVSISKLVQDLKPCIAFVLSIECI